MKTKKQILKALEMAQAWQGQGGAIDYMHLGDKKRKNRETAKVEVAKMETEIKTLEWVLADY
jgi:osmotically-inducible protein OsmY